MVRCGFTDDFRLKELITGSMLRVFVGILCELEYIIGLPRAKRTLRVPRSAIPRSGRVASLYRSNRNKRARFDAGYGKRALAAAQVPEYPAQIGVYKRLSRMQYGLLGRVHAR